MLEPATGCSCRRTGIRLAFVRSSVVTPQSGREPAMRYESHDQEPDAVAVTLHSDPDAATPRQTPFGLVVRVPGLATGGDPGSPALPRTQVRVPVPEPVWPDTLEIVEES